jgi:putative hemolysin
MLPDFVYKYINKIMHIDDINIFLKKYGHLVGIKFVEAIVKDFEVKEQIIGIENIPANGKFIFASNHPLGGFDAMILMKNVYKKLGSLKYLSNDILMNIGNLKSLFVPVNKHGGYARQAAKILHQAYTSKDQIMIFPAGLASRKIKGRIMDLEWKKHFISKSIEYKRDIIPIFVAGRNSNRFYLIAKLRKFFNIKWNLEMFFLADETFRQRKKNIAVYFGKPLKHTMFDKSKSHKQWAKFVKSHVYKLPELIS